MDGRLTIKKEYSEVKSTEKDKNLHSFSFFSNSKIKNTLVWLYENSPVNLSTLTGWHHPSISRLMGNPFYGRLGYISQDEGIGLGEEVFELAKIAKNDPRGMAYCSLGTIPTLLITQPDIIEQVAIFNDSNIDRNEVLKPFTYEFGHNNLFGMPISSQWKEKRTRFKEAFFTEKSLSKMIEPMTKIIDEYISAIEENKNEIPLLEKYTIQLAMDLFSRGVLNTDSLKENAEIISNEFRAALILSADPINMIRLKLHEAIGKYINLGLLNKLDKQKIKLDTIIIEQFLKPNEDKLRNTDNILQHYFHEESPFNAALEDAASILLAGHETTSRLLQFTLIFLSENPKVIQKLREEINKFRPKNGIWSRLNLKKMDYLHRVLRESLRLCPPVPFIPRSVTKPFVIAKIPRCKTHQEYLKQMSERDSTKDIVLSAGTIVLISPLITQRLESIYEDPLKFNPDRLIESDPCAWFPFGLGKRNCIGSNVALQEAMLFLTQLIEKHDLSAKVLNPKHTLGKTFSQGTLRHAGEVNLKIIKR